MTALYWTIYAEADPCALERCGGEHNTERGIWMQTMSSAVHAVIDLHVPTDDGRYCDACGLDRDEGPTPWPCPTVRAIADALLIGTEEDGQCPSCDQHGSPHRCTWGVRLDTTTDGDGRSTRLIVQPADGSHVASEDVEWLWQLVNGYKGGE
ncbi:hypothetical protein [Actinopolyspora alba]|nr:hypothetical protein [Actinopolyspora alba]